MAAQDTNTIDYFNQFKLIQKIGSGSFGDIYLGKFFLKFLHFYYLIKKLLIIKIQYKYV